MYIGIVFKKIIVVRNKFTLQVANGMSGAVISIGLRLKSFKLKRRDWGGVSVQKREIEIKIKIIYIRFSIYLVDEDKPKIF